ncbi:MAG TPA: DUF2127 domain-containing protein [Candidatus Acidoferrales bacterium]|nr:DUF2127 domain-containing protein [Candidatus Acidoferrales bacterium]
MEHLSGNSLLDRTFQLSITLKGLDGLLEIAGAFFFLSHDPSRVNALLNAVTFHLLSASRISFLAYHLLHASQAIAGHAPYFLFLFLMSHGVAKVTLVTALWFNRMWAYPMMIVMLVLFIAYQLYVMASNPNLFLMLLTLFDVLVIWLTKEEYAKQRNLKGRGEAVRV